MLKFTIVTLALALANPTFADEVLLSDGVWQMSRIDYDDGTIGCSTSTTNDDGTQFFFESWPTGTVAVALSDPDWTFPKGGVPESFGIRVNGGAEWTADGEKFDNTVQANVSMDDSAFNGLFEQLMKGTSMEIFSAKGTSITSFSLNGAAATLEYHFECQTLFPK